METLYAALHIFAGTTLVLFGIFLFTSPRKVGKQQRGADEARRHSPARYTSLKTQLPVLTTRSERSETMTRELEMIQERLAAAVTREMILKDQQEQLQVQIVTIRRQLASEKKDLETTRQRSADIENVCQEMNAENCRLNAEILQKWQEQLALCDENERQVNALRQERDQLKMKARLLDNSFQKARESAIRRTSERTRRFGIIPATAAIAIVAAITIVSVGTSSDKGAANTSQGPGPSLPASSTTQVIKKMPATRSAPRLNGAFQTIRPTGLFNGPSEDSGLIGTIAPGIKLNAIISRGGWLEVRSKHGRTSGFVRQESAVKISEDRS